MSDHRQLEVLLDQLADTEVGAEREETVRQLTDALLWHMDFEEHAIHPLVAASDPATAYEADAEHKLARECLDKLSQLVGEPGFGTAVEMLKAAIHRDIEREEYELFPALLSACTTQQLASIAETLKRAETDVAHAFIPRDIPDDASIGASTQDWLDGQSVDPGRPSAEPTAETPSLM